MPYRIVQQGGRFCVAKAIGGDVIACHDTRREALAQMRALYANEGKAVWVEGLIEAARDTNVALVEALAAVKARGKSGKGKGGLGRWVTIDGAHVFIDGAGVAHYGGEGYPAFQKDQEEAKKPVTVADIRARVIKQGMEDKVEEERLWDEMQRRSSVLLKAIQEQKDAEGNPVRLKRVREDIAKAQEQSSLANDAWRIHREGRHERLLAFLDVDDPVKLRVEGEQTPEAARGIAAFSAITRQDVWGIRWVALQYDTDRAHVTPGQVHLSKDSTRATVAHELAHNLEYNDPQLRVQARAFLLRRAEGAKAQPLGPPYGADEKAFADKFMNPYTGKDYGKRATEILSMGVQHLMEDPLVFATKDPEHFEFTVAALRGELSATHG